MSVGTISLGIFYLAYVISESVYMLQCEYHSCTSVCHSKTGRRSTHKTWPLRRRVQWEDLISSRSQKMGQVSSTCRWMHPYFFFWDGKWHSAVVWLDLECENSPYYCSHCARRWGLSLRLF